MLNKVDVLEFIKSNGRLPDQRILKEARLYRALKKFQKEDWTFKETIAPFKNQGGAGLPRKGKVKGIKTGLHKSMLKLGLFLMNSGGTGGF